MDRKSRAAAAPARLLYKPRQRRATGSNALAHLRTRVGQTRGSPCARTAILGLALLWAVLSLSACAQGTHGLNGSADALAPLPEPAAGRARIYFYRPQGSLFPALEPDVIVNGRKVGVSVVGEAFYRDAYPGRYEIFLTSDDDRLLSLSVAAGDTQFVRTSVAFGFLGPRLAPKLVEGSRGRREIQALTVVEPATVD